jgi:predicted nucleotidyltransferase
MSEAWLQHHRATIERATATLRARDNVLAVLVGGSVAHGFATASSDVDLMIVVADAEWERRLAAGELTDLDYDSPTYEGGYVDSKYISVAFLRDVAARGSENARFAFDGATVTWSRVDGLEALVREAARYPVEGLEDRLRSFRAHLRYWQWMYGEGEGSGNAFVTAMASPNVVLFAGRLILAHNRLLYPGYKWLLRVLRGVAEQPPGLMAAIDAVVERPDRRAVDALFDLVAGFRDWGLGDLPWGARFVHETELAWLRGRPPIADL